MLVGRLRVAVARMGGCSDGARGGHAPPKKKISLKICYKKNKIKIDPSKFFNTILPP